MEIKVSIIVPIYKVQNYLNKCINSILAQTHKNIEVILVDDGSPDECPQICDTYASMDSRVRVIHKQNGGLVSARKAGVRVAQGEYVACVDADDWIAPNYIEEFCQIIDSYKPDVICCGYYTAKTKEEIPHFMTERKGYYNKESLKKEIYPHLIQAENATAFLPTVWAKLFERNQYIKHQLAVPDGIAMGEDGACTIPLLLNVESMYIINKCMYYYRDTETSMTRSKKPLPWSNYDLTVHHLVDITSTYLTDLKEQLYRRIAHSFITVAKSRFNQDIPFKAISNEIKEKMNEPITNEALRRCKFKGSIKAVLIQTSVKTRSTLLIALLNHFW